MSILPTNQSANHSANYPKSNGQVVMIESPYSGDIDRNIRYLQIAWTDSMVLYGECAYASHGYMTQHPRARNYFVSDYDGKWDTLTREGAIERSHLMRHKCDKTVFYTDRGWSTGMNFALAYCKKHGIPYEERTVDTKQLAAKVPFMSEEFCRALITDKPYEEFFMD